MPLTDIYHCGSLIDKSTLVCFLQIVLYREEEVLDCECDMAMVHHLLSQIPQDLPYETLISRAGDLFVQFPPSELAKEAVSHERYLTLLALVLNCLFLCFYGHMLTIVNNMTTPTTRCSFVNLFIFSVFSVCLSFTS